MDWTASSASHVASWSVGWHSVTALLSKDKVTKWYLWVVLLHRLPPDSSVSSSLSDSNESCEGYATSSGNPALFQQLLIVVKGCCLFTIRIKGFVDCWSVQHLSFVACWHCNLLYWGRFSIWASRLCLLYWRIRYIEVLFHTFYCNFDQDIGCCRYIKDFVKIRGLLNRGSTVKRIGDPSWGQLKGSQLIRVYLQYFTDNDFGTLAT